MKLTVPAKTLSDALAYVSAAIAHRPVEPVLHGVHVDATGDQLIVSAFNYDMALRAVVDAAEITEPGLAVIPGKVFAAVAAKMHGNVLLSAGHDGPGAEILGLGEPGQSKRKQPRYVLDTFPPDTYPKLDGWFSHETTATLDGTSLGWTFGKVAHAAGREDTLPVLSGVHLESVDGLLHLECTDRYRLASYFMAYKGAFGDALVPVKTFAAIVKGLQGETRLGHTAGVLSVATARRQAAVRTLDGEFPKVRKLASQFPAKWAVKFSRVDMLDALERLVSIRDDDRTAVQLLIGEDLIELVSTGGNQQTGSEWVPCTTNNPDGVDLPLDLRINPQYFTESLKAHGVDEIEIGAADVLKPVTISGDAGMTNVIMPTRPLGA